MEKYLKILKKSKKVALFSHENPDPDTIGSTLALYGILTNMGKQVSLFCETKIDETYNFLAESKLFNTTTFDDSFDLAVAVDIADNYMLGRFENDFLNHPNSLRIDHHKSGINYAKENVVKFESATGILIFDIAKKLHQKITPDIATKIYFAICGDTGIFRNNNTDSVTFDVCSKLLKFGADFRKVYSEFFDKKTVSYVKASSNVLLNAELDDKFGYAIMTISKEEYNQFSLPEVDTLGNLPHTYLNCGYKIGAILKEKPDGIHLSFRSKFEYDVSKIAEKFGGGGHKNASGAKISDMSLANAKKLVKKEIENYFLEENLC